MKQMNNLEISLKLTETYRDTESFDQPLKDRYQIPGSWTSHRIPDGK